MLRMKDSQQWEGYIMDRNKLSPALFKGLRGPQRSVGTVMVLFGQHSIYITRSACRMLWSCYITRGVLWLLSIPTRRIDSGSRLPRREIFNLGFI